MNSEKKAFWIDTVKQCDSYNSFFETHGQSRVLGQVGRRHRLAKRDQNDPALQKAAKEMSLQCWQGLTRNKSPQKRKG